MANSVRCGHPGLLPGSVNADAATFDYSCSVRYSGYSRHVSVWVMACQRVDTGLGSPARGAAIAFPAVIYMAPSEALTGQAPSSWMWHGACRTRKRTRNSFNGAAVQKLTIHDPQSQRGQVGLLLNSGCVAGPFPVMENDPPTELRCSCSSPAVMWECEYFCSMTGDLCSKCCRYWPFTSSSGQTERGV